MNINMKILIAEDEESLAKVIKKIFEMNHYEADTVYNGEDALSGIVSGGYDAAVLDIMMPKMDGITVLQTVRKSGNRIPILLLTAKTEIDDKVVGLDSGASYYLTKPFDAKELLATVRAIIRNAEPDNAMLTCGNITLNRELSEISSPTGSFRLVNEELLMMEQLLNCFGHRIGRERLYEKIWGAEQTVEINIINMYISYLSRKLAALHADIRIQCYEGEKYALEAY